MMMKFLKNGCTHLYFIRILLKIPFHIIFIFWYYCQ